MVDVSRCRQPTGTTNAMALIPGAAGKDGTELIEARKCSQIRWQIHCVVPPGIEPSLKPNRTLILARAAANSSSESRLSETARDTATAPAIAEKTAAASVLPSAIPAALIRSARSASSIFTPTSNVVRNRLDWRGKSELRATIGHPAECLSR